LNGKLIVSHFQFLQRQNVNGVRCQPIQNLWQANVEGVNVPGGKLHEMTGTKGSEVPIVHASKDLLSAQARKGNRQEQCRDGCAPLRRQPGNQIEHDDTGYPYGKRGPLCLTRGGLSRAPQRSQNGAV
jgi:hypothetical protein